VRSRIHAVVLIALWVASPAHAAQHWGCTPGTTWSGESKPALWLNISSQSTGSVQIDGKTVDTTYAQTGLNRTWYWGLNDDGIYEYSISLRGDGAALYFDFAGKSTASEEEGPPPKFFTCREFSPKSKREIEGLAY
jgi:hypothetical protein